jgi:hypothetical protein
MLSPIQTGEALASAVADTFQERRRYMELGKSRCRSRSVCLRAASDA